MRSPSKRPRTHQARDEDCIDLTLSDEDVNTSDEYVNDWRMAERAEQSRKRSSPVNADQELPTCAICEATPTLLCQSRTAYVGADLLSTFLPLHCLLAGLSDVQQRDKAVALHCLHEFCVSCLVMWLEQKRICPLCKVCFMCAVHAACSQGFHTAYYSQCCAVVVLDDFVR